MTRRLLATALLMVCLSGFFLSCSSNDSAVATTPWARSVSTGDSMSVFYQVATDASSNTCVVGSIRGTGVYTFGTDVTAQSDYGDDNAVIVKYNSVGTAQWAKTVSGGSNVSAFSGVVVEDVSGNVYAVGYIYGTGTYTFGTGVTATGAVTGKTSIIIVKYDSSGNASWAKTVSSADNESIFSSVAVDSTGSIYAAGYIYGTGTYTFGSGVTATGTDDKENVVIVKYDSSGAAQWAKTVTSGTNVSGFIEISIDSSDNIYAAGYVYGNVEYSFGNDVTLSAGDTADESVVVVKYNTSGAAQWAKSVTGGGGESEFYGVAVDSSGNVYTGGYIQGSGTYAFGNSVTAQADASSNVSVILVKYNANGTAQWARTVSGGADDSNFQGVSVDASDNIYGAGYITGTGTYTFGSGVTATGDVASSTSVVLVKYNTSGTALSANTVSGGGSSSIFNGIATDTGTGAYAVGSIYGSGTFTFGTDVSAQGTYASGNNIVIVKYVGE